jgi:wyosine [tRNA(Phe)-imidazoG37] synthetase (radical SAM superfamily)
MKQISIVYGPVSSWRLGKSIGVDLLYTNKKICSFDCIYCQLGKTFKLTDEQRLFSYQDQLVKELDEMKTIMADYVTFSGVGEPTLIENLGECIDIVKSVTKLPLAVLTNSTQLFRDGIRRSLAKTDIVVAKLDACNEDTLGLMNRPFPGIRFDTIMKSIIKFRDEYQGKLALQMMFTSHNMNYAAEMAKIAKVISPDEIQINTPLRPCNVTPLSATQIYGIKDRFPAFSNVYTVYDVEPPEVTPVNVSETLKRRPEL